MAKSKVKEISFINEWEGNYGKMYSFSISFEDGTTGSFNAKKREQTTVKIGEIVEYEITGQDNRGVNRIKIVKPKFEAKGSFNDPVNNKRMARSMAQSCALIALTNLQFHSISLGHILKVADYFHTWIVLDTNDERNLMSLKWYAVERAVVFIQTYHTEKINSDEGLNAALVKIKENAVLFYNHIIKQS